MNKIRKLYNLFFPVNFFFSKWKLKDKVQFAKNTICLNSFFEGKNALHENTKVYNCKIGLCTYISSNSQLSNTKIGRYCSIADNVRTGFGTHPTKDFVSTFPSFYYDTKNLPISFMKGQKPIFNIWRYADKENKFLVEIGNDVWIGSNVLIMDGVKIGDGAIIAAGAVVTKDVEPYSIVGGVPAHHIKYRFTKSEIDTLLKIKWWEKDLNWIKTHINDFKDISCFINNNQ